MAIAVGLGIGIPYSLTQAAASSVQNQTIQFGALSGATTDGAKALNIAGSEIDFVSVTNQGTGSNWQVTSGRLNRSSGTPASQDGVVLTCTVTGGASIQVTISAVANAYGKSPADSWATILAELPGAGNVTVLLRDGTHTSAPVTFSVAYTAMVTFRSYNYPASVTHYSYRTGNAIMSGRHLADGASNMRFEYIKFYLAKPSATSIDDSDQAIWESQGTTGSSNIQFWRCEFCSDTINKSGYANGWPGGINRFSGTAYMTGYLIDECYAHDLGTFSSIRGPNTTTHTTNKVTQCRIKDCGNGFTSFTGSNVELSWNCSGPTWGNAQDAVLNHTSMHSYNGSYLIGTDFENILYKGNIAFGAILRNSSSAGKLDRVSYHPLIKYKNTHIIACAFWGATDNIAAGIDNCAINSTVSYVMVLPDRNSSIAIAAKTPSGTGFYSGDGAGGGDQKIITLLGAPDLSQVLTDESYFLNLDLVPSNGRDVYNIVAVDNTAKTVTVKEYPTSGQTSVQDGGTQLSLDSATYSSRAWSIAERRGSPGIFLSSQEYFGVGTITYTALGSGGADGTYALTFSATAQQEVPIGTFTVVGGSVVNPVTITHPGTYSSNVTITLGFAACPGLTGVNITAARDASVKGDTQGIYSNNIHGSTSAGPTTGNGTFSNHTTRTTLYTGNISDGDQSTEDGGLGNAPPVFGSYETNFAGSTFKALGEGSIISNLTNRPWTGALPRVSDPSYGPFGVGPFGGAVTWPSGFETLPMAGTINTRVPRKPGLYSALGASELGW